MNTATPAQKTYIIDLLNTREIPIAQNGIWMEVSAKLEADTLTKREASFAIGALKDLPRRVTETVEKLKPSNRITEDGMYRKDGIIYRVQRARGSGNLYGKRLDQETMSFEYIPGILSEITPADRMTLEEAKEFGALYGVCCVCATVLTNEVSIAEGIGPICGKRV